jgi:hypothetical protein
VPPLKSALQLEGGSTLSVAWVDNSKVQRIVIHLSDDGVLGCLTCGLPAGRRCPHVVTVSAQLNAEDLGSLPWLKEAALLAPDGQVPEGGARSSQQPPAISTCVDPTWCISGAEARAGGDWCGQVLTWCCLLVGIKARPTAARQWLLGCW